MCLVCFQYIRFLTACQVLQSEIISTGIFSRSYLVYQLFISLSNRLFSVSDYPRKRYVRFHLTYFREWVDSTGNLEAIRPGDELYLVDMSIVADT